MRNLLSICTALVVASMLVGSHALAQADRVCTPIGGVIIENHNDEFAVGEGIVVLGVISGSLNGGTFFVWPPPPGEDALAEGVITLDTGDILRVQSQLAFENIDSRFWHHTEQVTILFGTGAYQRASGSFEMHGSMRGYLPEMVMRYQGEVCIPSR